MNVYYLIDPDTRVVKYVGITKHSPKKRLAVHIKDSKGRLRKNSFLSNKEKWILSLLDKNKKPIPETVFSGLSTDEAVNAEEYLIWLFGRKNENGQLLNVDKGGHYDSDKTIVWNVGIPMNKDLKKTMISNQPNKKKVIRYDMSGNVIDEWQSIRGMCDKLNLDRRTVTRILARKPNYMSHKKFMFAYDGETLPKYFNKSSLRAGGASPHAKAVIQYSLNWDKIKEWGAISEIPIKLVNSSWAIGNVLKKGGGRINEYNWKLK